MQQAHPLQGPNNDLAVMFAPLRPVSSQDAVGDFFDPVAGRWHCGCSKIVRLLRFCYAVVARCRHVFIISLQYNKIC